MIPGGGDSTSKSPHLIGLNDFERLLISYDMESDLENELEKV